MAKNKGKPYESYTDEGSDVAESAVSIDYSPKNIEITQRNKKSVVKVKVSQDKRMNFDRYAKRKGIKATHVPGMRAFTKNPRIPRTEAEWDKFFENY